MIKIIEHGKYRIIKCEECECKFSFNRKEDVHWENPCHKVEHENWIVCPECGKMIYDVDTKTL